MIAVTIETDWDTREDVKVDLGEPGAGAMLVRQDPFTAEDWSHIESAPGIIRDDIRVTAWVCSDAVTPPVLDWLPPGE